MNTIKVNLAVTTSMNKPFFYLWVEGSLDENANQWAQLLGGGIAHGIGNLGLDFVESPCGAPDAFTQVVTFAYENGKLISEIKINNNPKNDSEAKVLVMLNRGTNQFLAEMFSQGVQQSGDYMRGRLVKVGK